ncbi:MAG: histidinol-phosphate aminotransferase family protein [Clostridia bacterium]|nr:histidinol-phosphate aminotransferase family protein [Clostridia bacterium]
MEYIPAKTAAIKPYGFEDASGITVKLDANESFVSLPQRLREKLSQIALTADYNRYPDSVSASAVNAYSRYIGVPAENIVAGNGSDELISIVESSLMSGGDKLLCAMPDFSMYKFYSGLAELEFCQLTKKDDFSIDVSVLAQKAKELNAKAVMFSNPCSPTGLGISKEEVLELVSDRDRLWIVDEAYMDFWDQSIAKEAINLPNVVVLRTCSKAFGLAALRLGFAISNPTITEALIKSKSPANVNYLTCEMAAAVISDSEYISGAIAEIKASSAELMENLQRLGGVCGFETVKSVANFVFAVPCQKGDAEKIQEYLKTKGVLVRRLGEMLRITAGSKAENSALFEALREYASER